MARSTQGSPVSARTLRGRWSERTNAAGWGFPADWFGPAVDAVCEAIVAGADVRAAAERLGGARAVAGISMGETLADIDVLAALSPVEYAEVLRRAVSLGWADRAIKPNNLVADPLTGLASLEYLQARLGEIYRGADVDGCQVDSRTALVVVRVDFTGRQDWERALPLMLTGEALRTVFDGGQTLARIGQGVAVVVAERSEFLHRRARLVSNLIQARTAADIEARIPPPRVWIESLPSSYAAALDLLSDLGR